MNELIKINYQNDRYTTSARDLWEFLGKPYTEFSKWFNHYKEYGFVENLDFRVIERFVDDVTIFGGKRKLIDYEITIDMGKELAMLQKSEKGKIVRQYLIELEKKWNSPEVIMARALKMADEKMLEYKNNIIQLEGKIEQDKPKVLFAEAVENSEDVILVKEMALILTQHGFEIGQNQLFEYLRMHGYLCKKAGDMYNLPTKKYEHLFKVTKRTIQHTDRTSVKNTPKVNGRGQMYFIKKFAEYRAKGLTIKDLLIEEGA
ncbi:hypothetical protein CIW83_18205 [Tissierella sp. P1]|uniref:phage antirepressor KilAC domain-containing protein n=1 Tax=Tissierella sp. P1 TaxID=1280483 RepID=UPI000BA16969|nr:phage antirepressor KilAC domain-containing protein [Tissierella sp. P1]OZV10754.1 hypothetical protein CIW83_18205 [Tissierella sp. P1]